MIEFIGEPSSSSSVYLQQQQPQTHVRTPHTCCLTTTFKQRNANNVGKSMMMMMMETVCVQMFNSLPRDNVEISGGGGVVAPPRQSLSLYFISTVITD